jgi:peptidoglycan/xylan/chitin deacetylase (PgdA/CDA1 family)
MNLRWHAKKVARRGVAMGAWAGESLRGSAAPRVHVLTYHRFGAAPRDPFCVAPQDFERQMRWLADEGRAIALADLESFLAGRGTLRDGAVLVTVDDGFRSLLVEALPILRRHGIPAVAFVPAGLVGEREGGEEARLDWSELETLRASGVVVGSHAWSHRSLGKMTPDAARTEMTRSRAVLEERLGAAVTAFAYPYGTRADFSYATTAALHQAGYTCGFTSQHGAIGRDLDPLLLPRVKVEGGEGLWLFRRLCAGGLDAWRMVDQTLWRLQASGS